jgi:hypothetical protein
MANGYMPRRDLDARDWMRDFARGLVERGELYKVTPQEAADVSEAAQRFALALARATNPQTRTAGAVAEKDDLRRAAELACRPVYARIKADPSIDAAAKVDLGMRPPRGPRSRLGEPTEAPLLKLVANLGHTHVITYENPGHLGTAKPSSAVGIQVFRTLSPSGAGQSSLPAARDVPGAPGYVGTFTRNPIRIPCSHHDDLKYATYVARWITRRGLVGPWSDAVSERVNCTAPSLSIDAARQLAAA